MLKSYLKVALRNLWKNRLYTGINITGLSVGLAACMLIVLFVRDELSYDKHFEDSERIYRLTSASNQGGDAQTLLAITTYELLPVLTANFPEMEDATRLDFWDVLVSKEQQHIWEENVMPVDSLFFDLFSFEVVAGDHKRAIQQPNHMVITETAAKRHFQDEAPLGQILRINEVDFQVAAIVKDLPANTHFESQMFIPMSDAIGWYGSWVYNIFSGTSHYNYFRLAEGVNPTDLEARINAFLQEKYESGSYVGEYFVQPLESIHLNSDLVAEAGANGNYATVLIFIATAIVIVLLACINYINLSIAGSFQRSREVGLKKVFGARPTAQVLQFQTESVLVSLQSCTIAVVLVEFLMPTFNELTGKQLAFDVFQNLNLVLLLLGIGLLIGVISGSFPAWFLLKIHTSQALKGNMLSTGKGKFNLRNALVVFQFFIAVILIACTFVIFNQMNFLKDKDLGVNTEQVVVVPIEGGNVANQYETIRQELLRNPGVLSVTASNNHPAERVGSWRRYRVDGQDDAVSAPTVIIAHDYFETLEATIVEGRSFDRDHPTDYTEAYVLNEAAVKFFNIEDPVGKDLLGRAFTGSQWSSKNAKIIGVVKDFNFQSLHTAIEPLTFQLWPEQYRKASLKLSGNDLPAALDALSTTWTSLTNEPFNYKFLDQRLDQLYAKDQRFSKIFRLFTILSLAVAALGLVGFSSFIVRLRAKELAIRKVLGAAPSRLIYRLLLDFSAPAGIALLLALAPAYWFLNDWLNQFAYRVSLSPAYLLWPVVILLGVIASSVLYQSTRVALENPTRNLRNE